MPPLHVAVVGTGISGLGAAWLLSQSHRVTVFEAQAWAGGHSHTVDVEVDGRSLAVDTGFIVYNEPAYPNLTALLRHLDVDTQPSDMSFAVSLDRGALEYAGTGLRGLFAQPRNLCSPRFWGMLRDLVRFYRDAPAHARQIAPLSLDDYLRRHGYGVALREDHLYPMAAAIWSTSPARIGQYPMQSFVRFCENHHLLTLGARPAWRTVRGGSRTYVERMCARLRGALHLAEPVTSIHRDETGVRVRIRAGDYPLRFDRVVLATHAGQALRLLPDARPDEQRLLGAFGVTRNRAVLHRDVRAMPRRRAVWSSWNYVGERNRDAPPSVTYWMNRLQGLPVRSPVLLTLNPDRAPAEASTLHEQTFEHPVFDAAAIEAQRGLWSLQGRRHTWYCGAYFGSGFHEDGLQAGLAVAEDLGGLRRPWDVPQASARIHRLPMPQPAHAT